MNVKYFSIFIAMLVLGNVANVPLMFLGVRGYLSLSFIFIVGFLTYLLSDLFWYWIGWKIGIEKFERIKFFRQKPERMDMMSRALDKYGILMLYGSKFIYTSGILTQVVAGAHRYSIKKTLLANMLGAVSLLVIMYSLALVFSSELIIDKYLENTQIALLVFFLAITIIHFLISKPLKKLLISKNAKKRDADSN